MRKNKYKSIAIIGSGISGLSSAYLLNPHFDITLYEQENRLGGHSRTVKIDKTCVDTGFIVFNKQNYPHLTALFNYLDVEIAKSTMSFGVSINNGWLEYSTQSPLALFAQKKNLLSLEFWKFLKDIVKFNNQARKYITQNEDITLGALLDKIGTGQWHRDYFITAMGAAIWSTPMLKMFDFPAKTFVQFFENHGLLTLTSQPQWYTVKGGSKNYVEKLSSSFVDRIIKNTPVLSVERFKDGVKIVTSQDNFYHDAVIFACHADEALKLLSQPTRLERELLGAFSYQKNRMVLHHDISFMPQNKKAYASWIYLSEKQKDETSALALSYWMNNLQPLETDKPFIVTLNPPREPQNILDEKVFTHPLFDQKAIEAQKHLPNLQGLNDTFYCGAYQRYGFHEDGLLSAVGVAENLGIKPPW